MQFLWNTIVQFLFRWQKTIVEYYCCSMPSPLLWFEVEYRTLLVREVKFVIGQSNSKEGEKTPEKNPLSILAESRRT